MTPATEKWKIHVCETHRVLDCTVCGVFDVIEVVPAPPVGADECDVVPILSSLCSRGTKSCRKNHPKPVGREGCERRLTLHRSTTNDSPPTRGWHQHEGDVRCEKYRGMKWEHIEVVTASALAEMRKQRDEALQKWSDVVKTAIASADALGKKNQDLQRRMEEAVGLLKEAQPYLPDSGGQRDAWVRGEIDAFLDANRKENE